MGAANAACAAGSSGFEVTFSVGGRWPSQASPFQRRAGRTGLGTKPPPQLGQTLKSNVSTQVAQNVHSKLQMRASAEAGGSAFAQCSHVGRSSSMSGPSGNGRCGNVAGARRAAARAAHNAAFRPDEKDPSR